MQPKPAFPFWTSKQTALYIELPSVGLVIGERTESPVFTMVDARRVRSAQCLCCFAIDCKIIVLALAAGSHGPLIPLA